METLARKEFEARLNDERFVQTMNRILDRLDVIESTLEKLHEAPGMVAMVTDIVDDTVRQASDRGVNLDERLRAALEIAEKLTEPKMVERLEGLLEMAKEGPGMVAMVTDIVDDTARQAAERGVNLDERLRAALEIAEKLTEPKMVERLDGLLEMAKEGPGMVAMMTDIVDDTARQASEHGVNLDERLRLGLSILERLTQPKMVEKLDHLLGMLEQGDGLVAMAVDSFDDVMRIANEKGIDPQEFFQQAMAVTSKMAQLLSRPETKELLESGVFDVSTLKVMSAAANALTEANAEPPKKVGLFGLMRVMKDSSMQKAMGFLTTFAKKFGSRL